ncbi:MAG: hypothetical protein H0W34_05605 [Pyrinomonadaceae bacterium]|nr:hypothetical protein [Pyrinomonadaceae bacterium]
MQYWKLMPLWYHLTFLAPLIPFCFLGAAYEEPLPDEVDDLTKRCSQPLAGVLSRFAL